MNVPDVLELKLFMDRVNKIIIGSLKKEEILPSIQVGSVIINLGIVILLTSGMPIFKIEELFIVTMSAYKDGGR